MPGRSLNLVISALAFQLLLSGPTVSRATVHRVPDTFATVQAALLASAPGDTVEVAAGVYSPSTNGEVFPLMLDTDDVLLLGAGMGLSILDAERTASVLVKEDSSGGRVSGFTITGGDADLGGGIRVIDSRIEIDHNLVYDNSALTRGSGIFIFRESEAWIHHNVVWDNFDRDLVDSGDPHGVEYRFLAVGVFEHNLVGRTDSNGLLIGGSAQPIVRHSIFVENGMADPERRGRGICAVSDQEPIIYHNLFHDNEIAALLIYGLNLSATEANDHDANDQVYNNLDGDPLFVDVENDDWHLLPASPAIDAGDPSLPGDPDGTVADLGPFYYDQSSVAAPGLPDLRPWRVSVYPNPFNPTTHIHFSHTDDAAVQVNVVDLRGRLVRTLFSGELAAGSTRWRWDGRDDRGDAVASGVYLVHARGDTRATTTPMLLLR